MSDLESVVRRGLERGLDEEGFLPERADWALSELTLIDGSHEDAARTGRGCIMNIVSLLTRKKGEDINDRPKCVSPLIAGTAMGLNDSNNWHSDEERTKQLLPLVPLMMETTGYKHLGSKRAAASRRHSRIVMKWLTRHHMDKATRKDYQGYRPASFNWLIADSSVVENVLDEVIARCELDHAALSALTKKVMRLNVCILKRVCLAGMPRFDQLERIEQSNNLEEFFDEASCSTAGACGRPEPATV